MKKLNLGCGYRKLEGYLNVDNRDIVSPDLVCDLTERLPFDDSSIDEVRAYDFLEHVPIGKTISVIEEIYRILKPGGKLVHFTPSTDGRGAFQDPTHQSFWNINSWFYFMRDECRALYGIKAKFSGTNENVMTSEKEFIIHVYGELEAVK